jgi:hypothetical protein
VHEVVLFVQPMKIYLGINAESENVQMIECLQVKPVNSTNLNGINMCINTVDSI